MPHRVFVVDDQAMARMGLRALLEDEPDLEVCGEAADAPAALHDIARLAPDLVIVDLALGSASGLALVEHLRARQPGLPALVVSVSDELRFGEQALRAGARGYVMKTQPGEVLLEAVRKVLGGGCYVSRALEQKMKQTHETTANTE